MTNNEKNIDSTKIKEYNDEYEYFLYLEYQKTLNEMEEFYANLDEYLQTEEQYRS
jgi:hypothetical protein